MTLDRIWSATRVVLLSLFPLSLSACSPHIGMLQPTPTINLTSSRERLAFAISSDIPDRFDLDCPHVNCTVHVSEFHASLLNGYKASVARYYSPGGRGDADLVLRLETVELEALDQGRHLLLHFSAQLEGAKGNAIRRAYGTIRPPHSVDHDEELRLGLSIMYEHIAAECFGRGGPRPAIARRVDEHGSQSEDAR